MSIWEYVVPSQETPDEVFVLHCIYCRTRLQSLKRDEFESGWGGPDNFTVRNVVVCPCCGWWYVRQDTQQHIIQEWSHTIEGAHGALKNLDLTNLSIPINEIRLYLCAKYEERFNLHPRLLEETVASVFRDLGYRVRVTGRSGDDGIDVVLDGDKGDTVGVQVKRYRSLIHVEQIRSFAGALVLAGYTKGIYVTTSGYQRGAGSTTARFAKRGLAIELLDAPRFYQALQISQRSAYNSIYDNTAPYNHCELKVVSHEHGLFEE